MSKFDKFLGFFLTIFQDVYICVSTENFEMHTANLPVGCAEKNNFLKKIFIFLFFLKKNFAKIVKNCQKF